MFKLNFDTSNSKKKRINIIYENSVIYINKINYCLASLYYLIVSKSYFKKIFKNFYQ